MKPAKSLKTRALELLARREHSRQELQRKLAPHAENPAELEELLDELAQNGWQSDERYAEVLIRSKSAKHGSLRLQQELAANGIGSSTVKSLLPSREDEYANACAVLRRKFAEPAADFAEKQKQIRFMLYRGFDMDTVSAALKNAWDDEN